MVDLAGAFVFLLYVWFVWTGSFSISIVFLKWSEMVQTDRWRTITKSGTGCAVQYMYPMIYNQYIRIEYLCIIYKWKMDRNSEFYFGRKVHAFLFTINITKLSTKQETCWPSQLDATVTKWSRKGIHEMKEARHTMYNAGPQSVFRIRATQPL